MSTSSLIQLTDVSAAYGPHQVLTNISWRIEPGQHWVITGPMAAGKSTLARCLRGELRVLSGSIEYPFLGKNASFEARRKAIHLASFSDTSKLFRGPNAVHYYQQRYNAFDADGHLTVRQYLHHGGFSDNDPEQLAMLRQIGIEALLERERIKLSSGQTRKMLIARALLGEPQILIIDNPYLGLDRGARRIFNELIDHLAFDRRMTIILSGHFQELPQCITHRIHLESGRIKASGTLTKVAQALPPPAATIDEDCLAHVRGYYCEHRPASTVRSIVRMEKVSVNYGEAPILQDVDWEVRPGEKWSLFGPNGSGKSTLLSLLYGDHPQAYANRIFLFDRRRGSGESIWDIKKRIGFTSPELHAYFDHNFTALELVLSGLWDGFIRRRPKVEQQRFAGLLLRFFDLEDQQHKPFRQLSTGTQHLLFFLRALIKSPELLLLDEPFQGFDPATVEKSRRLLSDILTEQHTLIFITHFEHEIPANVDKVFRL